MYVLACCEQARAAVKGVKGVPARDEEVTEGYCAPQDGMAECQEAGNIAQKVQAPPVFPGMLPRGRGCLRRPTPPAVETPSDRLLHAGRS